MIGFTVLLQVLDYASTILILLGIWGSVRSRKMWWVYCIGCGMLATVACSKGLPGVAIGGGVSVMIGIRNALYRGD